MSVNYVYYTVDRQASQAKRQAFFCQSAVIRSCILDVRGKKEKMAVKLISICQPPKVTNAYNAMKTQPQGVDVTKTCPGLDIGHRTLDNPAAVRSTQ